MNARDRVIVALDAPSLEAARKLLEALRGVVSFYKVGLELFTAHGWKALDLVKSFGGKIFLDLKLHDIPTTVARTAAVICGYEVDMFNVHALGGLEMMREVRLAVDASPSARKPLVLAVTILTSHDAASLQHVGLGGITIDEEVKKLALLAQSAGLDGVVSSPREIGLLRASAGKDFKIVTPGIRPLESSLQDQKRTLIPAEAFRAGADYIVIGRPITGAQDPRGAAEAILQTLSS